MKVPDSSSLPMDPSNADLALNQDRLLVVDDDPEIRTLLKTYLEKNGFSVSLADGGDAMEQQLSAGPIDLVLLDVMMPGRDGITLCREIRQTSWLPVIMLTAKNSDIDRILGIEIGADDYVTKPFNPRELLARINGVLRRSRAPKPERQDQNATDTSHAQKSVDKSNGARNSTPNPATEFYGFDGWTLDTRACRLLDKNLKDVDLTAGEFDLLNALVLSAGRAVTRAHLLTLTHGVVSEAYERSIDVLVSRLRTKLDDNAPSDEPTIKTIRGVGYLFAPTVTARHEL